MGDDDAMMPGGLDLLEAVMQTRTEFGLLVAETCLFLADGWMRVPGAVLPEIWRNVLDRPWKAGSARCFNGRLGMG
jgi:hypothetical protein